MNLANKELKSDFKKKLLVVLIRTEVDW